MEMPNGVTVQVIYLPIFFIWDLMDCVLDVSRRMNLTSSLLHQQISEPRRGIESFHTLLVHISHVNGPSPFPLCLRGYRESRRAPLSRIPSSEFLAFNHPSVTTLSASRLLHGHHSLFPCSCTRFEGDSPCASFESYRCVLRDQLCQGGARQLFEDLS